MNTSNGYDIMSSDRGPVISWMALEEADHENDGLDAVPRAYRKALNNAVDFGGKKFHNERFGGGIVFDSIEDMEACIEKHGVGETKENKDNE